MTVQKQDIDISWELSITMGVHELQHSWVGGWYPENRGNVIQFDERAYFSIGWGRNTNDQVIQAVTVLFPGWWLPTLSPIIMEVEIGCIWKVSTIGAHFHFHDYGRKGNLWRGHILHHPKNGHQQNWQVENADMLQIFSDRKSLWFFHIWQEPSLLKSSKFFLEGWQITWNNLLIWSGMLSLLNY